MASLPPGCSINTDNDIFVDFFFQAAVVEDVESRSVTGNREKKEKKQLWAKPEKL